MSIDSIVSPILNGPYDPPVEHFELDRVGSITGTVFAGRRPTKQASSIHMAQLLTMISAEFA